MHVKLGSMHVIECPGPQRGGGRGGKLLQGPEVLGAPENFLLGPSLFCVLNISAQGTRYLVFLR